MALSSRACFGGHPPEFQLVHGRPQVADPNANQAHGLAIRPVLFEEGQGVFKDFLVEIGGRREGDLAGNGL